MRCVFLMERCFPLIGGRESQVQLIASQLAARGNEVSVVALHPDWFLGCASRSRLVRWWRWLVKPLPSSQRLSSGVLIHYPRMTRFQRFLFVIPRVLKEIPIGGRVMSRLRWYFDVLAERRVFAGCLARFFETQLTVADILHSHEQWFSEFGRIGHSVARRQGIPIFHTPYVHPPELDSEGARPRVRSFIDNLNEAETVFALLPAEKRWLENAGVKAPIRLCGIAVKPFGDSVSVDAFLSKYRLAPLPTVLYVGRITPEKNVGALVSAARELLERGVDAQFLFIGPRGSRNGDDVFSFRHPRIRYLGAVSDDEKRAALSFCSLLCLPSMHEVLPNVLAEAWSLGKAVVCYPAYALKELVETERAGIVTAESSGALTEALARALADPMATEAMGERGRQLVERVFTAERLVDLLESRYRESLDKLRREAVRAV